MFKKLIVSLMCLFVVVSCYATDYSEIATKAAKQTNEKYDMDLEDKFWIEQMHRDLNSLERMRQLRFDVRRKSRNQYYLDTTGYVFGALFKLGIAYWGFSQKSIYGDITGGLFALSGTVQLFRISW